MEDGAVIMRMKNLAFLSGCSGRASLAARARPSALASALVLGMLASACGRGQSAEERQMTRLREDLSHVQADHDRFEQRLSALEVQNADDRALQPVTSTA